MAAEEEASAAVVEEEEAVGGAGFDSARQSLGLPLRHPLQATP